LADRKRQPTTIDEYLIQFPAAVQELLSNIRMVIKEAAPDAEERISYRMPCFAHHGVLVWFAAFTHHIGFYPTASGITAFKDELSKYKGAKVSVQFPIDQPIPYDLIKRMVAFRVAENIRSQPRTQK